MEVTQVIADGETVAAALDADWLLTSVNSEDGRRYLRRFTLSLATGGLAEELVIGASTSLQLAAAELSFDALADDAPEAAQVQPVDATGLRVTLAVPRRISRIRFGDGVSPGGKTTQLFRTDGDVISEQPVASYSNPLTAVVQMADGIGAAVTSASAAVQPSMSIGVPDLTTGSVPVSAPAEADVIDGRIVVRLWGGDGFTALDGGSLTQFRLISSPENLRVGVRLPALGDETFFCQ